jgi:hypothetical protein
LREQFVQLSGAPTHQMGEHLPFNHTFEITARLGRSHKKLWWILLLICQTASKIKYLTIRIMNYFPKDTVER